MTAGAVPAVRSEMPEPRAIRAGSGQPRVAYLMSRFPKLTETFVLDEILELERRGVAVEVFPLWREPAEIVHAEARPVVSRAHFAPTLNSAILRDNLRCLLDAPSVYLGTLATLVWSNLRSPRFLAGALAIYPKACSFALRMRALGVRHVHAHFASHPAAAAFVIGRIAGIPCSFTAHGSDLHREQAMLAEKVAEAKFVVAISQFNRRFILDRVGQSFADKIRVIHCGVDLARHPLHASTSGALEIGCVGTLHAVKGQRYLLDACGELSGQGIDWRCHLIGDGPDRRALEARARELGIVERVVFHGNCEREKVRALLVGMDVVAAPSVPTPDGRREGIPVALMEAGASGLPLVASRLSGIPELVVDGETGLLVEPGDSHGLAVALARLAAEPETRERLGAAVRERIAVEFSLGRSVERLSLEMLGATAP